MIRITSGVYGHYTGSGVEPKDKSSEPFELASEKEAELVNTGCAVYVDGGRTALPEDVESVPQYDKNSSVNELREIGKTLGLSFKVGMTKAEMVAELDATIATHTKTDSENDGAEGDGEGEPPVNENNEDKEVPPAFDPAQAVQ